ncbi:ZW10 interactor isoform X2 [Nannospalax galili]|uniref:ZW10 interactor isoform X2 n=2 Tax=Nannospalax galili TaxID=1026970 RepID=UPI000819C684|nr:ZW10 interactor isoform X2 [Nannospalax galili]
MDAAGTGDAEAERVLAEVADILEPTGLQEEMELPARILAEFERNSRKKDKLLCSQLQVVDFLQSFLAQEDAAQGLGPLASEDSSRQKALAAKEQWKELKTSYQEHVEAIRSELTQALPQLEEVRRKAAELREAWQQLQAKKQVAEEKLRAAQQQWQLQQENHLRRLAQASAELKKRQKVSEEQLDRLYQELEPLAQQTKREQQRLNRNQIYLQLLCTLHGKPLVLEAKAEDRATAETALSPVSR